MQEDDSNSFVNDEDDQPYDLSDHLVLPHGPPGAGFSRAPKNSMGVRGFKISEHYIPKLKKLGIGLLRSVGPLVGIRGDWVQEAINLFFESSDWPGAPGKWHMHELSCRSLIGCCLMYVGRLHQLPLSFALLASHLGVYEQKMASMWLRFEHFLPIKLAPPQPTDYLAVFLNTFDLTSAELSQLATTAERLLDCMKRHRKTEIMGKDPLIIAAVLCFLAIQCTFPRDHVLILSSTTTTASSSSSEPQSQRQLPIYRSKSYIGFEYSHCQINPKFIEHIAQLGGMKSKMFQQHMHYWRTFFASVAIRVLPWGDMIDESNIEDHLMELVEYGMVEELNGKAVGRLSESSHVVQEERPLKRALEMNEYSENMLKQHRMENFDILDFQKNSFALDCFYASMELKQMEEGEQEQEQQQQQQLLEYVDIMLDDQER